MNDKDKNFPIPFASIFIVFFTTFIIIAYFETHKNENNFKLDSEHRCVDGIKYFYIYGDLHLFIDKETLKPVRCSKQQLLKQQGTNNV